MRKLLTALVWPTFCAAQEVKPVESDAYLALIRKDTARSEKLTDSTHDMRRAPLRVNHSFFLDRPVSRILIKNNSISFRMYGEEYFAFGGNASISTEWQFPGREPATQNTYAQGRSENGRLTWKGNETGERFSFGPALSSLEFDGSPYEWDVNGRLVPVGTGNGKKTIAYNNNILQNGFSFSPTLTLNGRYFKHHSPVARLTFRAGKKDGQTIFPGNKQESGYFSTIAGSKLGDWELEGQYHYREQKFKHPNRNAFLNRYYQQGLISAASLDAKQLLVNAAGAENHNYLEEEHSSSFSTEFKARRFKVKVVPAADIVNTSGREGYRQGSFFYPAGISVTRDNRDKQFTLNSSFNTYGLYISDRFRSIFSIVSVYNDLHSSIRYTERQHNYDYHRRSHDLSVTVSPFYRYRFIETGIAFKNKSYGSSTTNKTTWFMPGLSAYFYANSVFNIPKLHFRLTGSYERFFSEPVINRSYAGYALTQIPVASFSEYLPLNEANTFNGLNPVRHRETNAGIEFNWGFDYILSANWFKKDVEDDVFPYIQTGEIHLLNMASFRNQGVEVEFKQNTRNNKKEKKLELSHRFSFTTYRNRITKVKDGFNRHPIAGFADVHKAIVKDQAFGVILGKSWLRNASGEMIIGNDGFPLVNNDLSVIADPNPDFTMKLSQLFSFSRKWDFLVDWEWRKGGEIWNGTEAMLDYYGMSERSATARNITGYVFPGVNTSGTRNNIPVSFYDPSLPIEQNRWVRYGATGVAEDYIQKADFLRINNISLQYKPKITKRKPGINWGEPKLIFSIYASNLMIWSPYKGADPKQLLLDQAGSSGLDFFNVPGIATAGFSTTFQF